MIKQNIVYPIIIDIYNKTLLNQPAIMTQTSQNVSVLSDMTNKIWAEFAKDWHKVDILQ